MARIYISSTFEDLKECRRQVELVVRRMGHEDVAMEYYIAEDQRPVDKCLADVARCDLYLGIFAWRYGWIPTADNPDRLSITEMEYRQALKSEKKCLIFLLDGKASWPPDFIDDDRKPIRKLREEMSEKHGAGPFMSAEDIGSIVAPAIHKWATETGYTPPGAFSTEFDLSAYFTALKKRYQTLALEGLTPPQKEEYLQMQLRSVFVEQNVRESPPPIELPKEVWGRLEREREIHPEDLPEGTTLEDLRRVRETYYEKVLHPVLDVLTDARHRQVIILGDPGSGKSTLARYILLSLMDPEGDDKIRCAFEDHLPLLIELRSYAGLCQDGTCHTFLEFLEYLGKTEGWHLTQSALHHHLKNDGRAVVVFDGLDEIFNAEDRERITRQIVGFASDYARARVIVTSRVIGYRRKILSDAGFAHFTLQDLDQNQVEPFVDRWYRLAMTDRPDEARERRERILSSFRGSSSIRQLAANPMLLTIMAIIGKHQELPQERWKLYDYAAGVLIQHWDVNKHLRDDRVDVDVIGEEDKKELLRRLAFKMQGGDGGLAGNYIHHEQLQAEFEGYLRERYQYSAAEAAKIAKGMMDQFRQRNFILLLYGANLYGFVHRAFLEFFCAAAFVHKFEKTRELSLEQLKEDVFGRHWADQSWHEVLRLICGMIDQKWVGEIITYLIREVYQPWPEEFGSLPPWNIALAVQCLGEVRNPSAIRGAAAQLLQTCCRLFSRMLKEKEERLADFLDTVIAPNARSVGRNWPGNELLSAWLSNDIVPFLDSFTGYLQQHSCGVFLGAVGSDLPELRQSLLELLARRDTTGSQCFAVHAFSELRRGHPENLELLRHSIFKATDGVARGFAIAYAAEAWHAEPQILPMLRNLTVQDEYGWARGMALSALAQWYRHDPQTLALLHERVVKDEDGEARGMVLSALAEWYRDDPETLPLLRARVVQDEAGGTRAQALSALAVRYRDDPETLPLLRARVVQDEAGGARTQALLALAEWYRDDPETLPLLRARVVQDEDVWVRIQALSALAEWYRDDPETLLLLRARAVQDEDGLAREQALSALAEWYRDDPEMLRLLRARVVQDEAGGAREQALLALAEWYRDDPETLRLLRARVVQDEAGGARAQALLALAKWYHDAPETLPLLRARVVQDEDGWVRRQALSALAKWYRDDPETLPLLCERAANDEEEWIRHMTQNDFTRHFDDAPKS